MRLVCAAVAALAIATSGVVRPATAQSPAPSGDVGYCTVQVTRVAPIDAAGTTQGVILMPTIDGSATLSGTISLYSSDNVRYDVPFTDTRVSSDGALQVLHYRFHRPVAITGAYVSALGGPDPGPCALAYPWTKTGFTAPSKAADRALANAAADAPAIDVPEPGTPDPLSCPVPYQDAHTIRAAAPPIVQANGMVVVRLTIMPDGKPDGASIAKVQYDDPTAAGVPAMKRAAIQAALGSTFETQIFRCKHVIGTYNFIVEMKAVILTR